MATWEYQLAQGGFGSTVRLRKPAAVLSPFTPPSCRNTKKCPVTIKTETQIPGAEEGEEAVRVFKCQVHRES